MVSIKRMPASANLTTLDTEMYIPAYRQPLYLLAYFKNI